MSGRILFEIYCHAFLNRLAYFSCPYRKLKRRRQRTGMPDSRQEGRAEERPPLGVVQRKEPRLSWNMYTSKRWKVGNRNVT